MPTQRLGGFMFENGEIPDEMKAQLEAKELDKIHDALSSLQERIHNNAVKKGFWDELKETVQGLNGRMSKGRWKLKSA